MLHPECFHPLGTTATSFRLWSCFINRSRARSSAHWGPPKQPPQIGPAWISTSRCRTGRMDSVQTPKTWDRHAEKQAGSQRHKETNQQGHGQAGKKRRHRQVPDIQHMRNHKKQTSQQTKKPQHTHTHQHSLQTRMHKEPRPMELKSVLCWNWLGSHLTALNLWTPYQTITRSAIYLSTCPFIDPSTHASIFLFIYVSSQPGIQLSIPYLQTYLDIYVSHYIVLGFFVISSHYTPCPVAWTHRDIFRGAMAASLLQTPWEWSESP